MNTSVRNTGLAWRVAHDHGDFRSTCTGTLAVHSGASNYPWEISFSSDTVQSESWRVVLAAVQRVDRNAVLGKNLGAFHIRLIDGRNYNFHAVGPNGRPIAPDPIFSGLRDAVASSRASR